jgi:hypothetical protein
MRSSWSSSVLLLMLVTAASSVLAQPGQRTQMPGARPAVPVPAPGVTGLQSMQATLPPFTSIQVQFGPLFLSDCMHITRRLPAV